MRAAAADRDRTIDVLNAAYGEGRLTKEEFDTRCARVLSAKTYADLGAVVADLPAGPFNAVAPYHPGYYPAPQPPTSGVAVASLICGIAEFFTLGIAAVPAVILGHVARANIKRTGERGDGMAIAGLVLGYLGIASGRCSSSCCWPRPASADRYGGFWRYRRLALSCCVVDRAATKASCGTSTRPIVFIRFLPSFCFSSSFRLRVMSPP